MKLTIAQVSHFDTKKDGSKLYDKYGKPYMRALARFNEYGQEQYSGFVYKQLNQGETIDAELSEETYNGKVFKKFKIAPSRPQGGMSPEQFQQLLQAINAVNANVLRVIGEMQKGKEQSANGYIEGTTVPYPNAPEANPFMDDVPFGDGPEA